MSDETTELPRVVETPDAAAGTERARVCPACGAFNAIERELCRRCAVDLASGEALPWPQPDPDTEVGSATVHHRPHPRRWLFALAAILAVGGVLLLGFVLAGVGPFAEGPSVPEASFDADAYPGETADLLLSDIATMTTRSAEGDRTFEAARMVDDTPETAWRSDGLQDQLTEDDALEIVDLYLDEPAWIHELLIRNGDQLDLQAYEEAGRVRQVRMTFDGGDSYLLNLLDEGRGQQSIELPEPELTTMVRLEVVDHFPGSVSDGIAISDLELRGWTASDDDADLAERRAEALPATAPRGVNG